MRKIIIIFTTVFILLSFSCDSGKNSVYGGYSDDKKTPDSEVKDDSVFPPDSNNEEEDIDTEQIDKDDIDDSDIDDSDIDIPDTEQPDEVQDDEEFCKSGITCVNGEICCEEGEECVSDMACLPVCETIRCGTNQFDCCNQGEICLDGIQCAPDCSKTGPLCGKDFDICCNDNEICLNNECVEPGIDCLNFFDCLDESLYCEHTIGQCLPLPEGEICEGEPVFMEMEPAPEWQWKGTTYNGKLYSNILASAAVGDVSGNGYPDIVVVAYTGSSLNDGILVVLDGRGDGEGNSKILFTVPGEQFHDAPKPVTTTPVALANFDDDAGLEIVYLYQSGTKRDLKGVMILDNDGTGSVCNKTKHPDCKGFRETGNAFPANYNSLWGAPTVADLNHDGMPDVIWRCQAMNGDNINDSSLDFLNLSGCWENTIVADLNEDGDYEIIDISKAYTIKSTGENEEFWTTTGITSGFLAIADIFPDRPGPEIVNIRSSITVIDGLSGDVLVGNSGILFDGTISIPGGGYGGTPAIADFDGDGMVEIATAGQGKYVVFDPDCHEPPIRTGGKCEETETTDKSKLILWTQPTQDLSSSRTGSSVFDFQGDGSAEVVYNDECFLHIYQGKKGEELVEPLIPNCSRTASEYPLVADVDGDGNSEILIISNKDQIKRDKCRISWKNYAEEYEAKHPDRKGEYIDFICSLGDCTEKNDCEGGVGGTCASNEEQCNTKGKCMYPLGMTGVTIYGDKHNRWVKTRPVWNQFNYHVTDFVLSEGRWNVPENEETNWKSHNNYRQNVQGGVLFPVPDLSVRIEVVPKCYDEIILSAIIENHGSSGVQSGVEVFFYRNDVTPVEFVSKSETKGVILPGGYERVSVSFPSPPINIDLTFSASIDDDNLIEECNSDNNASAVSDQVKCEKKNY
jgi:hypothetical protein